MDQRLIKSAALTLLVLSTVSVEAADSKVTIMESKQLNGPVRQEWLAEMQKNLLISSREMGPFGLSQDVTVQKITETQQAVIKTNLFPKAIAKIPINVVLGKSFLIGSREIKETETFPLDYKGVRFKVEVTSVRANQITFKNMATGEQVIKKMGGLPQGFERSKGFEAVPGMVPSGRDQGPIEVKEN